jgi:hypothetical protein
MMPPRQGLGDTEVLRHVHRLRSANVALAVGMVSAVAVQATTDSPIGFIGIPIAGGLGWTLAPRLGGARRQAIAAILLMAVGCAVLGAYSTALLASTEPSLGALAIGTFGVLLFGLPAFLLLVVPATGWAVITSWLVRHADERLVTADRSPD